jgi:hypothetical protein
MKTPVCASLIAPNALSHKDLTRLIASFWNAENSDYACVSNGRDVTLRVLTCHLFGNTFEVRFFGSVFGGVKKIPRQTSPGFREKRNYLKRKEETEWKAWCANTMKPSDSTSAIAIRTSSTAQNSPIGTSVGE